VRNNGKIGVNTLSFFFAEFDIDVHGLLVLIHVVHFKKSKMSEKNVLCQDDKKSNSHEAENSVLAGFVQVFLA
jgi:hypothetical protein